MNVKTSASSAQAAERHTGTEQHYMQVAGTNIEDFDRAMRSAVAAARRSGAAADAVEAEVTS